MSYILPLDKLSNVNSRTIGLKADSLGKLYTLNIPVPNGFVITATAFQDFLDENSLSDLLLSEIKKIDISDPVSIQLASEQIKYNILNHQISTKLSKEFFKAYDQFKIKSVAIRLSPLKNTVLAHINPLYLSVSGEASILELVKYMWADLFSPTNLVKIQNYRDQKTAIIIQEMINASTSGVVHTTDYLHQNKQQMLIEAIWGLGKYIPHVAKPDHYFIDYKTLTIEKKLINRQQLFLHSNHQKTQLDKINFKNKNQVKLTDKQIKYLAQISKQIHKQFFYPQTIEWAFVKNKLWIFQTQNLQDYLDYQNKNIVQNNNIKQSKLNLEFLNSGKGLVPGIVSGKLYSLNDLKSRGIVYTKELSPEIWHKLPRITGLIISGKKINQQLRSILREKCIPTIIDINIEKTLKLGRMYTIDGRKGEIYRGQPTTSSVNIQSTKYVSKPKIKLDKWKIWANLPSAYDSPFMKTEFADVIGGIKGELLLKDLDFHPQYLLNRGQHLKIVKHIENKLKIIFDKYPNKPLIYQISDLTSEFAKQFYHGELHEVEEPNPLLGFRGVYRHLHHLSLLKTELMAIYSLYKKYPKLKIMIPTVRNYQTFKRLLDILDKTYQGKTPKIETWLNLTTPANIINLPNFAKNIRNFQIDLDILTTLVLGVDPQNSDMIPLFNQTDPSILWLLKYVLNYAKKYNLKIIVKGDICGRQPDFVNLLKKYGASGICISPDLIPTIREFAKFSS